MLSQHGKVALFSRGAFRPADFAIFSAFSDFTADRRAPRYSTSPAPALAHTKRVIGSERTAGFAALWHGAGMHSSGRDQAQDGRGQPVHDFAHRNPRVRRALSCRDCAKLSEINAHGGSQKFSRMRRDSFPTVLKKTAARFDTRQKDIYKTLILSCRMKPLRH